MGTKLDVTGQIYGNLKAIKNTGEKYKGSYIWEFECLLCKKHVNKRLSQVRHGEITSCGCWKTANLNTMSIDDKFGRVEGTNVSKILSKKVQKNNTSGHVGVSLHKQKGKKDKHIAYIYFQGVRYHLGSYTEYQDAVAARETAEEKLHADFLNWYAMEYPERWEKINKK